MAIRAWLAENRVGLTIAVGLAGAAVVLVALSLRREPPVAYVPTAPEPREAGDSLVGPVRVTVDASAADRWVYFDFSRGSVVEVPGPTDWDLAFQRFKVMVNGGAGFEGRGAARELSATRLDSVSVIPASGFAAVEGADSVNPGLARWYHYGFTSHLLTPRERVYAVRTADGRYAVLRFLSYYCPGATPGCMTFEYVYQGDGSRRFQ